MASLEATAARAREAGILVLVVRACEEGPAVPVKIHKRKPNSRTPKDEQNE
jgi:hypothetical protein